MGNRAFKTVAVVTDGVIPKAVRLQVANWIAEQEADQRIIIEVKRWYKKHSARQRGYWFAVIVPAFMDITGYDDPQRMHAALVYHLWPDGRRKVKRLDGSEHVIRGSMSSMDTMDVTLFMEAAWKFAVEEYGLVIPAPNEWI